MHLATRDVWCWRGRGPGESARVGLLTFQNAGTFSNSERANPSRYCVVVRTPTGGGSTRIRSKARPPPMGHNAHPLRHHGDQPPPTQDTLNHFPGAEPSALPDIKASTQVIATYQSSVTASPASGSNPSRKAPSAWVRGGPRKYSTPVRLLRTSYTRSTSVKGGGIHPRRVDAHIPPVRMKREARGLRRTRQKLTSLGPRDRAVRSSPFGANASSSRIRLSRMERGRSWLPGHAGIQRREGKNGSLLRRDSVFHAKTSAPPPDHTGQGARVVVSWISPDTRYAPVSLALASVYVLYFVLLAGWPVTGLLPLPTSSGLRRPPHLLLSSAPRPRRDGEASPWTDPNCRRTRMPCGVVLMARSEGQTSLASSLDDRITRATIGQMHSMPCPPQVRNASWSTYHRRRVADEPACWVPSALLDFVSVVRSKANRSAPTEAILPPPTHTLSGR